METEDEDLDASIKTTAMHNQRETKIDIQGTAGPIEEKIARTRLIVHGNAGASHGAHQSKKTHRPQSGLQEPTHPRRTCRLGALPPCRL